MKDKLEWLWAWIWPLVWLALSLVMAMKIMEVFYWRPKRIEKHFSRQGIKGPSYRFFIGNVKEMVALIFEASSRPMLPATSHNILPTVLSFYHHWKKIYGSTFVLWFGPIARLTVADPDLIREIFVSRSDCFERYESHPLVRQLEGEGLVSLRGQKWAHHRKVITPTFHMDNLKLLMPLIGKRMVEMVEKWSSISSSSEEEEEEEFEIDVHDWFHSLTEDTISQTVFGRSYEDGKAVFQLQAQQMLFAAESFYKVLIPGYRYLPTRKNTISWRLEKEIRSKLVRLISRRKNEDDDDDEDEEEKAEEDGSSAAKGVLGLMIQESRSKRCSSMIISVHDMMEECKTFFFAGKQTTSSLLTWATVLLAMHQDWQENARHEVLSVCGSRDIPTRDHLSKLKTLAMVLYETLRLYPPAVATIRSARTDVDLGAYQIPRGTELLIPIIAVHHDTTLWGPDAAEFNPTRFADGIARAAKHPVAFIPFGLGARTCIGQNLALMEAKLTVAILLQRFSFRLAPSYVHAPAVLMLLYPRYGSPVIFRRLSSPRHDHTST